MKFILFTLLALSLIPMVFAQNSAGSLTQSIEKSTSRSPLKNLILGIKSTNQSGRIESMKADSAKIFKGKQELRLGYKAKSGWGAYANGVQTLSEYKDSRRNKWSLGDPSISLIHPNFYTTKSTEIGGYYRQYVPESDSSRRKGTHVYAYYLKSKTKLADGAELSNQINPKWFVQREYSDRDRAFFVDHQLAYKKKINRWIRWGVLSLIQYEQHGKSAPGFAMEVIPQVEFMLSSKTYISPRLSLPIAAKNRVKDGPSNATFEDAYAEIYLQTFL